MKKILIAIFIWFLPYTAYAGMGACHDGNGNIKRFPKEDGGEYIALELDGNHAFFNKTNCAYYTPLMNTNPPQGIPQEDFDRIYTVISTVPKDFIKWTTEPVEMTQGEKDVVIAAQQADTLTALKAQEKAAYDIIHLKALVLITMDEINILRLWTTQLKTASATASTLTQFKNNIGALPTLNDRTIIQLRNALEAKVDELTP